MEFPNHDNAFEAHLPEGSGVDFPTTLPLRLVARPVLVKDSWQIQVIKSDVIPVKITALTQVKITRSHRVTEFVKCYELSNHAFNVLSEHMAKTSTSEQGSYASLLVWLLQFPNPIDHYVSLYKMLRDSKNVNDNDMWKPKVKEM